MKYIKFKRKKMLKNRGLVEREWEAVDDWVERRGNHLWSERMCIRIHCSSVSLISRVLCALAMKNGFHWHLFRCHRGLELSGQPCLSRRSLTVVTDTQVVNNFLQSKQLKTKPESLGKQSFQPPLDDLWLSSYDHWPHFKEWIGTSLVDFFLFVWQIFDKPLQEASGNISKVSKIFQAFTSHLKFLESTFYRILLWIVTNSIEGFKRLF